MGEIENKMLGAYESAIEADNEKSYSPLIESDGSAGLWDPELKARMDLTALTNLFFSEDWPYIIIDKIASMIAALPLRIVKEITKGGEVVKEPVPSHPFQKRLDEPNDHESYYQWMYSIIADHCITGNAIIWDATFSRQLIKIPTQYVQLHFDQQDTRLAAYHVFQSSSEEAAILQRKTVFPVEEIIHIRRPNPSSMYWGLSPLLPGKKSILFNRYSTEYLNNFYVKGAQPGVTFTIENHANEEMALRMLRSLELAHTGRANQRRNMILPRGVSASTLEQKISDQQLNIHMAANRETIINLYGMPKHMLSLAESGSLGSEEYKIAVREFWQGPLKTIMQSIEWSLWRYFKDEIGEKFSFQFDTSDVAALRDDDVKKAELAAKMLATHTVNEIRAELYQMEPIAGGEVLQAVQKAQPQQQFYARPPDPQPAPVAPTPDPPAPTAPVKVEEPEDQKALMRKQNTQHYEKLKTNEPQWAARRERLEAGEFEAKAPEMQTLVMDLFADQAEAAIKAVRKRTKAVEVPSKARLMKELKDALNKFEEKWLDDYVKTLSTTVDVGYNTALELPFNMPNKQEIEASRMRNANKRLSVLEERGLETFANMTRTTTEKIMREVTNGVANSLTIKEIADNIAQVMTDEEFTLGRANTIARTEVLTASSLGQAAAMTDAAEVVPNLKKVWVNAGDTRVRGNPSGEYKSGGADHWKIGGEMVDHDKAFSNGLMFPRDPTGGPDETINCRCTFIMAPADEAEAMGLQDIPAYNATERNPP